MDFGETPPFPLSQVTVMHSCLADKQEHLSDLHSDFFVFVAVLSPQLTCTIMSSEINPVDFSRSSFP